MEIISIISLIVIKLLTSHKGEMYMNNIFSKYSISLWLLKNILNTILLE